jgi:hypothetical protein
VKCLPLLAALALALLLQPWQASAQRWTPKQQEVWGVVESHWRSVMAMDSRWMQGTLHSDEWRASEPYPHDEVRAGRWPDYGMESVSTVVRDLVPMEILCRGDTAVVHYDYSQTQAELEGKHRTVHGCYTDTLVKEGSRWRLLAWAAGVPHAGA